MLTPSPMPSLLGTRQHWAALDRKLGELLACPCPCMSCGSAEDSRSWLFVISLGWQWLAAPTHKQQAHSIQTPAGPSPCTTPSARDRRSWPAYNPRPPECTYCLCAGRRGKGAGGEGHLASPGKEQGKVPFPTSFLHQPHCNPTF